jgi:hypothetical protein
MEKYVHILHFEDFKIVKEEWKKIKEEEQEKEPEESQL